MLTQETVVDAVSENYPEPAMRGLRTPYLRKPVVYRSPGESREDAPPVKSNKRLWECYRSGLNPHPSEGCGMEERLFQRYNSSPKRSG